MGKPHVVISPLTTYERHGWYSPEVTWFLLSALADPKCRTEIKITHKVDPVMAARNLTGKRFLAETKAEWLCMIDNDMRPAMNLLRILDDAHAYHDIIVPQMHLWNEVNCFPALCWEPKEDLGGKVKLTPEESAKLMSRKFVELKGCGTGCIFIRRHVLEQMPYPWFRREFDADGKMTASEDMIFIHECVEKGIRVFGSTEHVVGHWRTVDLSTIPVPEKEITAQSFQDESENQHVQACS